jgi:anaerobic selenocysteine-containing dehydrogenase
MELDGQGIRLHETSYDGRPNTIDGNPRPPDALGACSVLQQASVLAQYDPDRSDTVKRAGRASSWDEFSKFAKEHFAGLRGKGDELFFGQSPRLPMRHRSLRVSQIGGAVDDGVGGRRKFDIGGQSR